MTTETLVRAPADLDGRTRAKFRDECLAALERMNDGDGTLVIDLGRTRRLDSAALGMMVMLQLRAAERRIPIRLQNVSEEIRFLLLMTRLEERFEIVPRAGA